MKDKITIMIHSDNMDKLHTALVIANGALAMGMEATLFFTFWGLHRLRKGQLEGGQLSRHNLFGIGKWLLRQRMKRANAAPVHKLLEDFKTLGGKLYACEMCMRIFGLKPDDMIENMVDEYSAVGTYINEAKDSKITLFV